MSKLYSRKEIDHKIEFPKMRKVAFTHRNVAEAKGSGQNSNSANEIWTKTTQNNQLSSGVG
jgi:hypothetical protein